MVKNISSRCRGFEGEEEEEEGEEVDGWCWRKRVIEVPVARSLRYISAQSILDSRRHSSEELSWWRRGWRVPSIASLGKTISDPFSSGKEKSRDTEYYLQCITNRLPSLVATHEIDAEVDLRHREAIGQLI